MSNTPQSQLCDSNVLTCKCPNTTMFKAAGSPVKTSSQRKWEKSYVNILQVYQNEFFFYWHGGVYFSQEILGDLHIHEFKTIFTKPQHQ